VLIIPSAWGFQLVGDLYIYRRHQLVKPKAGPASWDEFPHVHHMIHDQDSHNQLQVDLIEHQWHWQTTISHLISFYLLLVNYVAFYSLDYFYCEL
jgi:hypothetical protein